MAKITDKQVEHLAELSSLEFSESDKMKMKKDLEQILEFVDKIENANIDFSEKQVAKITLNELREDEPKEGISQEKALQNAPKAENGYYVVSKVVE